jgi:hypothetical protein
MEELIEEEKKNFLLDTEKAEIETKILETIQKEHEIVEEIQEKKKMTKAKLIEEFIALQKSQGEIKYEENVLKKMTKADLIKKIANYSNEKISSNFPPPDNGNNSTQTVLGAMSTAPAQSVDELMAVGIYQMNLCVVKVLETLGHTMREQTRDINVLENLSDDVEQRKEAFLVIFKQIYLENKDVMVQYLTPMNQYFILMSQLISTTAFKNIAKKKEEKE